MNAAARAAALARILLLRCALRLRGVVFSRCSEWPRADAFWCASLSGSGARFSAPLVICGREARLGSAASTMPRFTPSAGFPFVLASAFRPLVIVFALVCHARDLSFTGPAWERGTAGLHTKSLRDSRLLHSSSLGCIARHEYVLQLQDCTQPSATLHHS